jgi:hypothetical protein
VALTGDYDPASLGFEFGAKYVDNIRWGKYLLDLRMTSIF